MKNKMLVDVSTFRIVSRWIAEHRLEARKIKCLCLTPCQEVIWRIVQRHAPAALPISPIG